MPPETPPSCWCCSGEQEGLPADTQCLHAFAPLPDAASDAAVNAAVESTPLSQGVPPELGCPCELLPAATPGDCAVVPILAADPKEAEKPPAPLTRIVVPAFNPARTRVIILTWPDDSITKEAAGWLWSRMRGHMQNVICVNVKGPVDVVRNVVVKQFCLAAPKEIDQFLFMDRDMRPDASSDPVLTAEGDVVGAMYETGNLKTWSNLEIVHMGLVRVKRAVLEALSAEIGVDKKPVPVFYFARTAGNMGLASCECVWFASRAKKLGFKVTRAGWCGHDKKGVGAWH